MDAKLLTENGWKTIATRFKLKDNSLQRALAAYEKLEEERYAERLKGLGLIGQVASALKKGKEAGAIADAAKYLDQVAEAADAEKTAVEKAQAAAEKSKAQAAKQAAAEGNKEQEQEEEEAGDYATKLSAGFQKLKSGKGLVYQFIVCDAKPHCGLMVAKKIGPKHKEELTKITGSKRFLHLGTCHFENGHFVFSLEQPVTGLARKLQDSIKNFTGKKLPILVGTEAAEEDEGKPAADGSGKAAAPAVATLEKAPQAWQSTRGILDNNIKQLKQAVRNEFAGESPALLASIEQTVAKLDVILDRLDHRLSDSLAKAHAARDPAARQAELNASKAILADYIKYVRSEPLIEHIDANPFGMQTNLKHVLTDSLTHLAQAIG